MIGKVTDQMFIRGFDYRRSDTAKVSKNLQYDIMKKILYTDDLEATKSELIAYVKNLIKSYESVPLSDIGIPFGFSKSLEQYGGVDKNGRRRGLDPEVRGALYSNEYLHTNFGAESKVKLLYINSITGYPQTDCICFENEKLLPKLEVNYKKMIDATIRKKIERILLVCRIGWNEIESERRSLF